MGSVENKAKKPKARQIRMLHLLLSCLALLLALGPAAVRGEFFGYGSDWLSQHLPLAETLRSAMLDSGRLIPLYLNLGGGSSIYDFAYYGLLRPDVLLGCLLPQVGMEYILAGYSLAGIVLGTNLLFWWLRRKLRGELNGTYAAAFAAVLYAAALCFFHAHNQLMFVNYLPFLILTLIGIDRLAEQGKGAWLVTAGLSLVYLHSFYYSVSCLAVCGVYAADRVRVMRGDHRQIVDRRHTNEPTGARRGDHAHARVCDLRGAVGGAVREKRFALRLAGCVCLSIGLCAVLLLPTGLDILSGSKDGGTFAAQQLKLLDLSLEGMLYAGYGMGLTLISLYCLLVSLTARKTRFLAACLLTAVTIPAVSLVLNGLLYARGKILIPFLVPMLLLCAKTFCGFLQDRQKPPLWAGMLCLVPWAAVCANKGRVLTDSYLLFDWLLLMGWILWMRRAERKREALSGTDPRRRKKKREIRIAVALLVPCIASWTLQSEAGYVDRTQIRFGAVRQALESAQRSIEQTEADKLRGARWEILSEGYTMSNYAPLPQMQRSSMYSSMTQPSYSRFFYDIAGNAIPARNRVALVPGKNPLFNTLMGVRYVTVKAAPGQAARTADDAQARPDAAGSALPPGYEVISCENGYVTGRNPDALPIAFGTDRLLSQKDFTEQLQTISAGEQCKLAEALRQAVSKTDVKLDLRGNAAGAESRALQENLQGKVLILSFDVTQAAGREITIDINGMRNKLSGRGAPYPNENTHFTYVLDASEAQDLHIEKNSNEFVLQNLQCRLLDLKAVLDSRSLWEPDADARDAGKGEVFRGTIEMQSAGFFETTYPFRDGYTVAVDSEGIRPQRTAAGFLVIPLAEGTHEIQIDFLPPGYRAGWVISLLSLGLFGLTLCAARARQDRARDPVRGRFTERGRSGR